MPAHATDFVSHRFSTRELPERMRLPQWRESFARGIVHADIEPLSSTTFHADARLHAMHGLRTLALKGSAMRFKRLQSSITDGDDSVGFIVCSRSRSELSQRSHEVELRGGDAIAILHSEPAILTYADGMLLGLALPRDAMAERVTDVEALAMRPIARSTEAFRLLRAYLRSAFKEGALASPRLRGMVVAHIHDLVALSIGEDASLGESTASAVMAARHSAVLAYIEANFQDPGLSVQTAARGQGISPRYLQRLMASSGSSFTGHVNELRLQQAFKLLTRLDAGPQRISDIALEVGFSDVSHFNRLFRARFGDSPSGVRGTGKDPL
ncbi:helix-turn-helix transcriptional regulator [Bradyrhizobium tropiciagri]|uniref:helix-turn-helix domain-containing protein n=1 Tax=Bradyrhizobium tropiciagri TaxID=312253 RepID=UPI001BA6541D|nr:AraC family transcriptional regulator [Bradyrhizobium tropiciagri]MBR0869351.1 helix-turn-helix transcriptional regulator [Bradyrhizobium tropiciagri]